MPPAAVIAHRGASGLAPENTLAAFDLALEHGADVLELDVRLAGGGEIVLAHDETGDVAGLARLSEVLDRYAGRARLLVDLKDPHPRWEGRVVGELERRGLRDEVVVQSFDLAALARLHARHPWLRVCALFGRVASMSLVLDRVPMCAQAIGPWHGAVDEHLVAGSRARGLAVLPWTVDDTEEARRLLALGVDGLITDRPDRIAPVVRRAALRLVA